MIKGWGKRMKRALAEGKLGKAVNRGVGGAVIVVAVMAATLPLCGQSGERPVLPSGDARRGRALVESEACLTCHAIEGKGGYLGPDLSGIGSIRTPEQLERSLVSPDEEVLPENRLVRIVTLEGSTLTGRLLNQDAFSIQLIDAKGQLRSFLKNKLREHSVLKERLMPPAKLSPQELADVVSYLYGLKVAGN
jgi:putative heme-binding domain-containing protein